MIKLKLNSILENLQSPASLLIRHAERPDIPSREVDHMIKITDQGRISAEELGREIGNKLTSVTTSPLPRCLDTSEAIIKGSGKISMPISLNWRLGNPGVWVTDDEAARSEFLKYGYDGMIRNLAEGRNLSGFRPLKHGVDLLLGCVLNQTSEGTGISVFISHDAVIAPLIGYMLGKSNPGEITPGYLEGALLCRTESGIRFFWRERWHHFSRDMV